MAESERTALLIERDWIHGVALAGGVREGSPSATALSWPLSVSPASAEGTEAAGAAEDAVVGEGDREEDDAPGAARAAAFRQARAALRIEAGCALALPTSDLITRVLVLPPADRESLGAIVRLQMEKIAPCAGEELSVGFEVIAQEESGVRLFAAAIPQERLDALALDLAGAGLRLTRLDAGLLGWWRQLQGLKLPALSDGLAAVLFEQGGEWDLLLAEGGELRLARGLGTPFVPADLGRELTLSLLNCEMEGGPSLPRAILVVSAVRPDAAWLQALQEAAGGTAVLRWIDRDELGKPGLGCALRESEAERLDLVPPAWRSQERDLRKRRRFLAGVGAAVGLWIVLAGLLFTAPHVVRWRTAAVAARITAGEAGYRAVSDVRQRVRLIRAYMDRSQSLLEILRDVCTVMPDGMDLASLTYRRDDAVKLMGDAEQPTRVYALKDALDASGRFENTRLSGPTRDARLRYRFEIEARFKGGAK